MFSYKTYLYISKILPLLTEFSIQSNIVNNTVTIVFPSSILGWQKLFASWTEYQYGQGSIYKTSAAPLQMHIWKSSWCYRSSLLVPGSKPVFRVCVFSLFHTTPCIVCCGAEMLTHSNKTHKRAARLSWPTGNMYLAKFLKEQPWKAFRNVSWFPLLA